MRRVHSRILLEVTAVRVERLQDISEEDATAEGAEQTHNEKCRGGHPMPNWSLTGQTDHANCLGTPKYAFNHYWNSINGPDAWEKNPWVWIVEFKRLLPK